MVKKKIVKILIIYHDPKVGKVGLFGTWVTCPYYLSLHMFYLTSTLTYRTKLDIKIKL